MKIRIVNIDPSLGILHNGTEIVHDANDVLGCGEAARSQRRPPTKKEMVSKKGGRGLSKQKMKDTADGIFNRIETKEMERISNHVPRNRDSEAGHTD